MNPDVKTEWLEALRSGKYKQGVRRLRTESDEYCCLGVLCDVAAAHDMGTWFKRGSTDEWAFRSGTLSEGAVLPTNIASWAGLTCDAYVMTGKNESLFLTAENDAGASFETIADLIERYL